MEWVFYNLGNKKKMKNFLTNSFPLNSIAGVRSSVGAASCPARKEMRKGGFFIDRVNYKPECLHAARYGGGLRQSREQHSGFFYFYKMFKNLSEVYMESRLFEGLRKDVAQQYVNLYERITLITGEVCALAKAIEVLSIQDNFGDVGLGYFGSIINEKCREIDNLLDGFVSYPTIYLELKERKAEYV